MRAGREPLEAAIINILGAATILALAALWQCSARAGWKPEYAAHPPEIQQWYKSQHNARGEWCCDSADGHPYDGDYIVHPDGSVTVDGEHISKDQVLSGPNPTNRAVWWYRDLGGSRKTYCFALGPGT